MKKNMERKALGASVLFIMSGQAVAANGLMTKDNAYEFNYSSDTVKNIPSSLAYSLAVGDTLENAEEQVIIGSQENFSRLLAADVQPVTSVFEPVVVSTRVSERPITINQAYDSQIKRIELTEKKEQLHNIEEKLDRIDNQSHYLLTDEELYAFLQQKANEVDTEVAALQELNSNDTVYASVENNRPAENSVYNNYETYESYKPKKKKRTIQPKIIETPVKTVPKKPVLVNQTGVVNTRSVIRNNNIERNNLRPTIPEHIVVEQKNQPTKVVVTSPPQNATQVIAPKKVAEPIQKQVNQQEESKQSVVDMKKQALANQANKQNVIQLPNKVGQPVETKQVAETVAEPTKTKKAQKPVQKTPSMVVKKPKTADDALKKQEGDATSEKNLKEVFTSNEKRYSLLKKGNWGLNYDARYSYFRDSRIDIATEQNSSRILRFRVEEDAQHTLTNTIGMQYGLRDNVTVSADLPVVAKSDLQKDTSTVGLGDMGLGVRWEPFPIQRGKLPVIVNANVSLPTGDSPYKIDKRRSLATGKGYYSFGGGLSTRKYIDPVVLFGSASMNYGLAERNLDQSLGNNRYLVGIKPNLSLGMAVGFAYSLNYDVSLTMSYQQAFSVGSEFTVRERDDTEAKIIERTSKSADQTSATMNMALGIRVSPKTIVNTSVGIGLTEDSPDVSFGVSFPLDFAGFGKKK